MDILFSSPPHMSVDANTQQGAEYILDCHSHIRRHTYPYPDRYHTSSGRDLLYAVDDEPGVERVLF